MLLAMGVCAALVERATSGRGQVIDAAMVDGVAVLSAAMGAAYTSGYFSDERGTNLFDSGTPYYDCYETADGEWLAVAALEAPFYADFLTGLGLADGGAWPGGAVPDRDDTSTFPQLRDRFTEVIASRTMAEWMTTFADLDACVCPVRTYTGAASDPHLVAAWHLGRGRRCGAAVAGAPLRPHAHLHRPSAGARRPPHRRGAARRRVRSRRDRPAPLDRCGRLPSSVPSETACSSPTPPSRTPSGPSCATTSPPPSSRRRWPRRCRTATSAVRTASRPCARWDGTSGWP